MRLAVIVRSKLPERDDRLHPWSNSNIRIPFQQALCECWNQILSTGSEQRSNRTTRGKKRTSA